MAHIVKINGETVLRDDWHTEDVIEYAKDMGHEITEDQAVEILHRMARRHDANVGINWEVIGFHVDMLLEGV